MEQLVGFMLRSIATEPDAIGINVVEGKASVLYEVVVADADRARLFADDRALLRSVQAVLSASAGRRKAIIEIVDALSPGTDEATEDPPTADTADAADAPDAEE